MPPIIIARQLGKTYRSGKIETHALRDATFTIHQGEFIAIVGPSGSGNSTLFYLLGGLTRASRGSVTIDGIDFNSLSDAERTRRRGEKIGFVFQRFNLLPTLTARGNIELAHSIAHAGKPFDQALLKKLAELLRIEARLDNRPSELGQTVRMITHNPEAAAVADRILHVRDGRLHETHPLARATPQKPFISSMLSD